MSSTPNLPIAPEQRLLAAIVFTDVAGFSARVQLEESNTLKLLERDFAAMREFSALHSGTVIKTTGDGLLLYFTSAVHAVEWALRTQRHFAEQAKALAAEEILRHRVGVHVGDIFVRADDVMGDGVNVAARVQAEAPPGGICISQTVYSVVKNKLKLDVLRLEPRKLKNIQESVQMYHLLLQPLAPEVRATPSFRPAPVTPEPTGSPLKRVAIGSAVAVAIAVAAGLLYQAYREQQRDSEASKAAAKSLGSALGKIGATNGESPSASTAPASGRLPGPAAGEEFDFARLAAEASRGGAAKMGDDAARRKAAAWLPALEEWVQANLARYTRAAPLGVPRGSSGSWTIFTERERRISWEIGGAVRSQNWPDLTREMRMAIVLHLLRIAEVPPAREVVRGAEAFAYVNELPEMGEALLRERRAGVAR